MFQNNELSIQSFLNEISNYIVHKNHNKKHNPTKRRDVREITLGINKLIQSFDLNDLNHNSTPNGTDNKVLYQINEIISAIVSQSNPKLNKHNTYKLVSAFADIYSLLGDIPKAIEHLEDTLSLCLKMHNLNYEAYTKFSLGKYYSKLNNWEQANNYLLEAEQYYESINDFRLAMECKHELGNIYYKKGKYLTAYRYNISALNLGEKIEDKRSIAEIKSILGIISRILGNKNESEKFLESASQYFKTINDDYNYVENLNNLSLTYLRKSNYQKALTGLNECIDICHNINDLKLFSFIYLNKALFYLEVGDPRNAAKFCTKALKKIVQSNNYISLAKVCHIYGNIFKYYQQYKIADNFFNKCIQLYEILAIPLGYANCCSDYAEMLIDTDQVDEAVKYYKSAQEIYIDLELDNYIENLEKTMNSSNFPIPARLIHSNVLTI